MKIATTFNDGFAGIVPSLNLLKWPGNVTTLANSLDIIDTIVLKFHNQSSIKPRIPPGTLVDVGKAIKDISFH